MKFPINRIKSLGNFLIYSDILFVAVIIFFFSITFYNYKLMIRSHLKKDQINTVKKIKDLINDELINTTEVFQLLDTQKPDSFTNKAFLTSTFDTLYHTDTYFKVTGVIHPTEAGYLNGMDLSQTDIVKYPNYKKINGVYIIPVESSILTGKYAITMLIDNFSSLYVSELKINKLFERIKKSLYYHDDILLLVKKQTSQIIARSDSADYPYWEFTTSDDMVKIDNTAYTFTKETIDPLDLELIVLSKPANYLQYIYLSKNYLIILTVLILLSMVFRSMVINKYNYKPIRKLLAAINKNRMEKITLDSSFHEWIMVEKEYNHFIDKISDSTAKLINEINERIKAQESLTFTKKYLDTLINELPSVIISINTDRTLVHWNTAAAKEFKLDKKNTKDKKVEEVVPFLKSYLHNITDSIKQNKPIHLPKEYFISDNSTHYKEIMIIPLHTDSSRGVLIKIDDITEKVNYQEFLIQTEKLVNIGGLAAGLANEINNPLSGIVQATQNLKRRLVPGFTPNDKIAIKYGLDLDLINKYITERNITKTLDDISDAALRGSEVLKNMLNFTKHQSSSVSSVGINTIIENALYLFLNDYNIRNYKDFSEISILKELDESNPSIDVVQNEIEIVIFNLLKNATQAIALKMFPENVKPYIKISYTINKNNLTLVIEDNGTGYHDYEKNRIFSPFLKKDMGDSLFSMGLSTSYFIITEKHSGTIDFESQKEIGTKFIIKIPVKQAQST